MRLQGNIPDSRSEYLSEGVVNFFAGSPQLVIFLIFIGIIGLLISFGSLIVAFLTFFDKRQSRRNKSKK